MLPGKVCSYWWCVTSNQLLPKAGVSGLKRMYFFTTFAYFCIPLHRIQYSLMLCYGMVDICLYSSSMPVRYLRYGFSTFIFNGEVETFDIRYGSWLWPRSVWLGLTVARFLCSTKFPKIGSVYRYNRTVLIYVKNGVRSEEPSYHFKIGSQVLWHAFHSFEKHRRLNEVCICRMAVR